MYIDTYIMYVCVGRAGLVAVRPHQQLEGARLAGSGTPPAASGAQHAPGRCLGRGGIELTYQCLDYRVLTCVLHVWITTGLPLLLLASSGASIRAAGAPKAVLAGGRRWCHGQALSAIVTGRPARRLIWHCSKKRGWQLAVILSGWCEQTKHHS